MRPAITSHRRIVVRLCSLLCLALSVSCSRRAAPWSWDEHVGIVAMMQGKACLTIGNGALAAGTRLKIVATDPPREGVATVATGNMCASASSTDSNGHLYDLSIDGGMPESPLFALAVLNDTLRFRSVDDAMAADLDGDGHDDYIRVCTSGDRLHFNIWSDTPLTGTHRWHRDRPFGSITIRACTIAEATGA
jgi:hypothetical protein